MAYYDVCPKCGATLDPGEPCDCEDVKQEREEFFAKKIKANPKTGQFTFCLNGKDAGYVE